MIIGLSGCDGSEKTQFALYFKTDIDNLIGWVDHPSFMRTDDSYSSIYVCKLNNEVKTTYPFHFANDQIKGGSNSILEIKVGSMIYFQERDGKCTLIAEIKKENEIVKIYEKQLNGEEIKSKNWTSIEMVLPIRDDQFNKDGYSLTTYFKQDANSEILIDDFVIHYRD